MTLKNTKIKYYQYPDKYNVGDTLSEHILRHFFGESLMPVKQEESGKLIAVGSIMSKVKNGDVVWGTGCIANRGRVKVNATFLAVRGKMTRELIDAPCPEVYGDPALLLPLIYNPTIRKTRKVGYIPHYVDKKMFPVKDFIDVALPWKEFIDKVLECEHIVASSLHGLVIAEAYGIPVTWAEYSNKVIGGGFKFRDYLTGTGRKSQGPGKFPPIPDLKGIQEKLSTALKNHYSGL